MKTKTNILSVHRSIHDVFAIGAFEMLPQNNQTRHLSKCVVFWLIGFRFSENSLNSGKMSEENGKQSVSDNPARKENHPGVVATEPYVTPKKVDNRKRSYDGRGSKIAIVKSCTQELLLNGESVTRCILEDGCDYVQKVFRQSNFERHFRLCHPVAFDVLGIGPPSEKSSSPNTEPAISIRMTVQRLLGGIVKLVTVHGLPFEAMEWEGFTEVVGPLLKAYNLTINRHNITKYVAKAAEGVNWMISQEVNGRMISLKLDIVSKMYRSMLGINCQYINNSGVVTKRNLGKWLKHVQQEQAN